MVAGCRGSSGLVLELAHVAPRRRLMRRHLHHLSAVALGLVLAVVAWACRQRSGSQQAPGSAPLGPVAFVEPVRQRCLRSGRAAPVTRLRARGGLVGDDPQSGKPSLEDLEAALAASPKWSPLVTRGRMFAVTLMAEEVGKPIEELCGAAEELDSNMQRDILAVQLLSELSAFPSFERSAALQKLIRKTWLFHEDGAVAEAMRKGAEAMAAESYAESELHFASATRLDPSYAEAWKKLASAQYQQVKFECSIDNLEKALAVEPAHFGALSGMGLSLMSLKRYREAANAFRSTSGVHPMAPGPVLNWALAMFQQVAFGVGEVLIPFLPQWGALIVTGMILLDVAMGPKLDWASALGASEVPVLSARAQEVRRTLPDGSIEVRTTMRRLTRTGESLGELRRLVEQMGTNEDRVDISARLLDELASADTPERARTIAGLTWDAWFFHEDEDVRDALRIGGDFMDEGDLQRAEGYFSKAVLLDPKFPEAWNRLATVHYLMQSYDASLSDIDHVLALEPRHFGALSGRGSVYMDLRQYDQAAAAFQDSQEVYPLSKSTAEGKKFAEDLQAETGARMAQDKA
eukprot:CAMPEP_0203904138 /NCGR_PEP_ID=MMETSP0359-20131031/45996_1 /ASSEMBLY_ACC=CAM_ASM_000338 /TAXON_ID=268821 /ORGANISM="Scrippsiella Hangoei, Strain SHTV-5" /LENGTH=575 /DNA_ID=CAMNT_0050828299 /DNA_START=92 /DNA_END=1819 /DNA_ORIENTATION=-